jgi:hypothetical protein
VEDWMFPAFIVVYFIEKPEHDDSKQNPNCGSGRINPGKSINYIFHIIYIAGRLNITQ